MFEGPPVDAMRVPRMEPSFVDVARSPAMARAPKRETGLWHAFLDKRGQLHVASNRIPGKVDAVKNPRPYLQASFGLEFT